MTTLEIVIETTILNIHYLIIRTANQQWLCGIIAGGTYFRVGVAYADGTYTVYKDGSVVFVFYDSNNDELNHVCALRNDVCM